MYQQQNYHTANYQGNMQGHDSYLRSDSQRPSSTFGSTSAQSQYRGLQRNFQPTGYVQSFYQSGQQGVNAGFQQSQFGQIGQQSQFAGAQPQAYHTANYRGNQQGHDAYLREDHQSPSFAPYAQQSFGAINNQFGQSSYSQQGQVQNPQSYHMASYQGNQQGHDSYLRSDSQSPNQGHFQSGFGIQQRY